MSDETTFKRGKPIGELNGPWARLFKVSQLLIPVFAVAIIPWLTWTTKTINQIEGRVALIEQWQDTAPDALRIKVKAEINQELGDKIFARFDALITEISALKLGVVRLETQVAALQRQLEKKQASSVCPLASPALVLSNERQKTDPTENALGH